jgi:CheY-like chemotaxis protein
MPPEVQHRAFDLLFTTKEVGERKGQGLGLAVVYNVVVRHHNGLVEIDSSEQGGTAIHVYLPRGTETTTEDSSPTPTFRGGDETILVIEDEPEIADLTREVLENLGYSVLTAFDGEHGLRVYREHRREIDLVLLDRTMPKLSGQEVLRRMLEIDPEVRVIISTGDTTVEPASMPGAQSVLHKPYRLSALFDTIRDALGG